MNEDEEIANALADDIDFEQAEADQKEIDTLTEQYGAYMHGIQTGVAQDLFNDNSSGTPKHLRVGINSAMVNDDAVASLLMEKGVFTRLEYVRAITAAAKREKERYEALLSRRSGIKITLA